MVEERQNGHHRAPTPTLRDSGRLVIAGVRVITGTGAVIPAGDVLVEGGRIRRLKTGSAGPDHAGADLIDGRGMTLIPGLVDAHCHLDFLQCRSGLRAWLWSRTALPKALSELVACGITAIRTMADPPERVLSLRRRAARGRVRSPRLVSAGPALTAPGGHPQVTVGKDNPWLARRITRGIRSAGEGRAAVRRLHRAGADLIKIVYQGGVYADQGVEIAKLSPDAARAVIEEAHRLALPVSAHTHYEHDVRELLGMGIDSLEHGISEQPVADPETLDRWREAGVPLVPTLVISRDVRNADGEPYLVQASRNLRAAHEAGVRIAAGTDSMVGALPADSLHDELRLMVEAGLTPHEALQAATRNAAELLRLEDRGVIAEGAAADLVLLGADPLEDISNVGDIRLVIKDGRIVHRAAERSHASLSRFVSPAGELVYRETGADEAEVRCSFAELDGTVTRTIIRRDPSTGEVTRTETIESDERLVTRRWTYETPAEDTRIEAEATASSIRLTGAFEGEPVSRTYALLGRRWMQGSVFDASTFIAVGEPVLEYVAIGTSGHGALQLTEFELTRTPAERPGPVVAAELVMPRWRRWWSADLEFDPRDGQLLVARLGKNQKIRRIDADAPHREGNEPA
ncbi:amidohydrolase family protein [Brachybacterium hainanense]|uniref:Amidohydrolase family protein n=1 Tax=Brachybacterium hainanense TaxID=1541174 RepID=A0ABV6RC21_9MICO